MSKNIKTIWQRMIGRCLPPAVDNAPAPDVDRNTNTLGRLEENDPVLACVRDHLFAQFSNELVTAMDRSAPPAVRIGALDSASGLRQFMEDLEARRQGWNEDRLEKLRQAEEKARREAEEKRHARKE
jgi:hypothetical protein